jgi:hypothetical protein
MDFNDIVSPPRRPLAETISYVAAIATGGAIVKPISINDIGQTNFNDWKSRPNRRTPP